MYLGSSPTPNLSALPASCSLSADPTVTGPASLFEPYSNLWGSTAQLTQKAAGGAPQLAVRLLWAQRLDADDSCTAVTLNQARTGQSSMDPSILRLVESHYSAAIACIHRMARPLVCLPLHSLVRPTCLLPACVCGTPVL